MIFSNIDAIVRRTLLEKGLPIHYYLEFLVHGTAGVRELSFDTLQIINTVELSVNNYNSVDLPDDCADVLALNIPRGGRLIPVPQNDSLSPLRYHDDTGAYQPPTTSLSPDQTFLGLQGIIWFWNINDYGEPTGRFFGASGASDVNGYRVVKERRQIQLTQTFTSDTVVLMYLSDGQRADNASQIDVQAIACIQAYINWKRSPGADMKDSPQARTFYNEKRLLRARMNTLTSVDIIHILRKNYTATIKN